MTNRPYEMDMPSLPKLMNMEDAASHWTFRDASTDRGRRLDKCDVHNDILYTPHGENGAGCIPSQLSGRDGREEHPVQCNAARDTDPSTEYIDLHHMDGLSEKEEDVRLHLRGGVDDSESCSESDMDTTCGSVVTSTDTCIGLSAPADHDDQEAKDHVFVPSPSYLLQDLSTRFAGSLQLVYNESYGGWFLQDRQRPLLLELLDRNDAELNRLKRSLAERTDLPVEGPGPDHSCGEGDGCGIHLGSGSAGGFQVAQEVMEERHEKSISAQGSVDSRVNAIGLAESTERMEGLSFDLNPSRGRSRVSRWTTDNMPDDIGRQTDIQESTSLGSIGQQTTLRDRNGKGRATSPRYPANSRPFKIPQDQLIVLLRKCFASKPYWTASDLSQSFQQPETQIVDALREIAVFGPWQSDFPQHSWSWKLQSRRNNDGQRSKGKERAESANRIARLPRLCYCRGPDCGYCQSESWTVCDVRDL
ncbi:hypothetical protein SMMN14_04676 [Sphaerulina musiva]